jgi:hypothetical protein
MADTTNISGPSKGMLQDVALLNTDANVYKYALNCISEDLFTGEQGFLQNEQSNVLSVSFPPGYQVVGFVEVPEQNRTLYFLTNPATGNSQIGEMLNCNYNAQSDTVSSVYCKNCPEPIGVQRTPLEKQEETAYCFYTMLVSSPCLAFDVHYPVDVEYKLGNCSLNLYFTDNINERRYIYFNYENDDVTQPLVLQDRFKIQVGESDDDCKTPIYSDDLDCEKIKFHPNYQRPCVSFEGFVSGGNLQAGTYQVLIAYADVYGSPISQYFPSTQPAALSESKMITDTAYTTTKALHFRVSNLQINDIFKYYNIVIAQTVSNYTQFIFVGTFSTTLTDYVYTGFETTKRNLDATEVFFRRPFYKTSTGITKANDYLFFANVQEYRQLNLQPLANKIHLQWVTVAIKEGDYHNAYNSVYYRGYQRDEVYPFAIVFEFNNGRETPAYHIPGRAPNEADLEGTPYGNDYILDNSCSPVLRCHGSSDGGRTQPAWLLYNTATVTGTPHQYSVNCSNDSCWEYGEFCYWESTEKYPNIPEVWGDLCGTCIRHHKFPDSSVTHIHDGYNADKKFKEYNFIYPIGVKLDPAQISQLLDDAVADNLLTQDERDSIVSYRIVRGNRVGNKGVVAKGLLYDMLSYADLNRHGETSQGLNSRYYFPNYPYNDMRADPYLEDSSPPDIFNQRFTFHSPDTSFTNAAIGTVLKVETEEYGESEGMFTRSDCQAKQKLLSVFIQTMAVGLGISAALSATSADGQNQISNSGDSPTSVISNALSKNSYDIFTGSKTVSSPFDSYFSKKSSLFSGGTSSNLQRLVLMLNETQKILDGLAAIAPYKNLASQYNSVGKYNNYVVPDKGWRIRNILASAYLSPDIQVVDTYTGNPNSPNVYVAEYINNWQREESVFLKLDQGLNKHQIVDTSKQTMTTRFNKKMSGLNNIFYEPISSYYVSIKQNIPDQYGQICNIDYLEAANCSFYLNQDYTECNTKIFGGDTFINRFAFKRKFPIFQYTLCNVADGSDVKYTNIGNLATPRYYYDTMESLASRLFPGLFEGTGAITDINAILSTSNIGNTFNTIFDGITAGGSAVSLANGNKHNYDAVNNSVFYQDGLIPLFVYGIPYFLVESDVNVDLRYAENNKDKDFYPHTADLRTWLQEDVVPIATPNYYLYNNTYSRQNHETPIITSCITNWHDFLCENINFNRLVYSQQQQQVEGTDNWLNFRANDYYDFPLTYGKLISADGIEDDKVLVRLTKATQIFNAYNTIQATGANIQVGTGGMFATRPQDIAVTDLGYAGTQHVDIKHTEYGHFWADAERGNVFNLATGGRGIEELGKDGMHSFFKQNLPFQLSKDFPEYQEIDNNLNGVGLHYGFDKRFNRILMTKLDYKCLDKQNVKYDAALKQFYILNPDNTRKVVELYNPKYFCNKSWTISYDLSNQCWKSFHSYKPNFYNDHISNFDSSIIEKIVINGILSPQQKLYTHNVTNKSYQVFYGKLEPFIIETTSKQSIINNTITNVEYYTEAIRYHNEYDQYINPNITFNKAIVSTPSATSGLINLHVSNPEDLTEVSTYPKRVPTGYEVVVTNTEGNWRFNDFFDVTRNKLNNLPIFTYLCNNADKQLNTKALNYDKPEFDRGLIRGKMSNIIFIQDQDSNHKLIFAFTKTQQKQSFR